MLQIAVCASSITDRLAVVSAVRSYFAERALDVQAASYDASLALLGASIERGGFDLYFLDIDLPDPGGIALGSRIRRTDRWGRIVYLTGDKEFAAEDGEKWAFQYLLKPLRQERVYSVLDEITSASGAHREACILVKTREGIVRIGLDSILYAECASRMVVYRLRDGTRVQSVTMTESFRSTMQPLLKDERFLLCGASICVNLHAIRAVEKEHLVLAGGQTLVIPKRSLKACVQAWQAYWSWEANN